MSGARTGQLKDRGVNVKKEPLINFAAATALSVALMLAFASSGFAGVSNFSVNPKAGIDNLTCERRQTSNPMFPIYAAAAVASLQD